MLKFDYRHLQCPQPVVETRRQLLANPAQQLEILVADRIACENISRLAESQGYRCAAQQSGATDVFLTLTPIQKHVVNASSPAAPMGATVILCSSDQLGSGDPELGQILLKNFFITLTDVSTPPDLILLVNSAVKLACSGSDALEALIRLADLGTDIAACGLCLDFYQLKDQLQIGRVTNMLEIAEAQLQAARIITP